MNHKRILFIEANTDDTIGGSYYSLLGLIKYLDRSKFEPFILFYQKNVLIPEFKNICPVIIHDKMKGLVIKRDVPGLYRSVKKIPLLLQFLLLGQKTYNFVRYCIADFLKIVFLLSRLKIDLVHINNSPAHTDWLIACKLLKIKCIAHLREYSEPTSLQKTLVKYYDTIISISNSVTTYAKIKGIYTDNFVLIHNGIDLYSMLKAVKSNPNETKKEFGLFSNNNVLIGVVGNIKAWKGQHVIIEAVRLLKKRHLDIRCLLVGDVSDREGDINYFRHLKDLVTDNGLSRNIIFTGYRKDIPNIVSVLDILVHTSVAPEPFGRVILEGMVFSKPVIATAHGGPVEIIKNGISGFLVSPNNPKALAQKIDYLICHSDIAKNIGQMARKRVEECFSIQTNVRKTEYLYSRLLF